MTVVQFISSKSADIEVSHIKSPVDSETAWEIESLLLKILEYGDYSFRSAMCGKYGEQFRSVFYVARCLGRVVGAAGGLYSLANPATAIFGPVCIDQPYRRQGWATRLCERLLDYLQAQGVMAVYLGVKPGNCAIRLYEKLGFSKYRGIVMRKLFSAERHSPGQSGNTHNGEVQSVGWQDFANVAAMMCEPADMKACDLHGDVLPNVSKEPEAFLPLFPRMMKRLEQCNGNAYVALGPNGLPAGLACIYESRLQIQPHLCIADFTVQSDCGQLAQNLLWQSLAGLKESSSRDIVCYCPANDERRKEVLESAGARIHVSLPKYAYAQGRLSDVHIYKFRG